METLIEDPIENFSSILYDHEDDEDIDSSERESIDSHRDDTSPDESEDSDPGFGSFQIKPSPSLPISKKRSYPFKPVQHHKHVKLSEDGGVAFDDVLANPEKFSASSNHYVVESLQQLWESHYDLANTRYNFKRCSEILEFLELHKFQSSSHASVHVYTPTGTLRRELLIGPKIYPKIDKTVPLFKLTFYLWYQLLRRYNLSLKIPVFLMLTLLQRYIQKPPDFLLKRDRPTVDQLKQDQRVFNLFMDEWKRYMKFISTHPVVKQHMNSYVVSQYFENVHWSELADTEQRIMVRKLDMTGSESTHLNLPAWDYISKGLNSDDFSRQFPMLGIWAADYRSSSVDFILSQPPESEHYLDTLTLLGHPFNVDTFHSWKKQIIHEIHTKCIQPIYQQGRLSILEDELKVHEKLIRHLQLPSPSGLAFRFLFQSDPSLTQSTTLPAWFPSFMKDSATMQGEQKQFQHIMQAEQSFQPPSRVQEDIHRINQDVKESVSIESSEVSILNPNLLVDRWIPAFRPPLADEEDEDGDNETKSSSFDGPPQYPSFSSIQKKSLPIPTSLSMPSQEEFDTWLRNMAADSNYKNRFSTKPRLQSFINQQTELYTKDLNEHLHAFYVLYCKYNFLCNSYAWSHQTQIVVESIRHYFPRITPAFQFNFETFVKEAVEHQTYIKDRLNTEIPDSLQLIEQLEKIMDQIFVAFKRMICFELWHTQIRSKPGQGASEFKETIHQYLAGLRSELNTHTSAERGEDQRSATRFLQLFQSPDHKEYSDILGQLKIMMQWIEEQSILIHQQSSSYWVEWTQESGKSGYEFKLDRMDVWLKVHCPFPGDLYYILQHEHAQLVKLLRDWYGSIISRLPSESIFEPLIVHLTKHYLLFYPKVQNWSILKLVACAFLFIESVEIQFK